jgi:hypothetical protein
MQTRLAGDTRRRPGPGSRDDLFHAYSVVAQKSAEPDLSRTPTAK